MFYFYFFILIVLNAEQVNFNDKVQYDNIQLKHSHLILYNLKAKQEILYIKTLIKKNIFDDDCDEDDVYFNSLESKTHYTIVFNSRKTIVEIFINTPIFNRINNKSPPII